MEITKQPQSKCVGSAAILISPEQDEKRLKKKKKKKIDQYNF